MNKLFAAMAKAFPEIEGATKDRNNPHFKSKYADLSSVVEAIKPALVRNDLFYAQKTHDRTDGVCVETIVGHSSGEVFSFGELFVPAAKRDPQGFGSALTYARRYSLMTAFGVCPEDDDGNAGTKALNGDGEGQGQGRTDGKVSPAPSDFDGTEKLLSLIEGCQTFDALRNVWSANAAYVSASPDKERLTAAKDARKAAIEQTARLAA